MLHDEVVELVTLRSQGLGKPRMVSPLPPEPRSHLTKSLNA
jgi:hypothetical protein